MDTAGVVIDTVANLYRQPDHTVDLVTQAILGTTLSILDDQAGWYYVLMPDHYQGWIEAANVRLYAPGEAPYASTGRVAQAASLFVFVYHEPSVTSRTPAQRATIGARLEVLEREEGWVRVALPDRSSGWVQRGDVRLLRAGAHQPRRSVAAVIATAKRFLGVPYLWGGSTPLGIDCSGFTQLVYHLNGVSLLRDADIQYTQPGLTPVAQADLQPGDLLFFGGERITHTGMYIGRGRFIHCTTYLRPVVQISRLDEPHWTGLYQGARRP